MPLVLPEKAEKALKWIVSILEVKNVLFQISGGLAAKAYGSPRPLNDIDIDIPQDGFAKILSDVKDYIIFGPANYKTKKWDLYLMTLNYYGQEIDIGCADVKIYDECAKLWRSFSSDLADTTPMTIAGILVPVTPKTELLAYKRYLNEENHEHHGIDIEAIS